MKALINNNTIGEVFPATLNGTPLADRYPQALIEQLVDVPDDAQPGWELAGGQWSPPPGLSLDSLKTAKEDEVWAAIRAEMNRHYDQPWQTAASQLHSHYKELMAREDVLQEIKDQITLVLSLFVALWQYLLVGSSVAGSSRVAAIRALTTTDEVEAYTVDLSDWVAIDPQITMSQITVPAALGILPQV